MIRRRQTLQNALMAVVLTIALAVVVAGKSRAQEAPSSADASAIQTVIEAQINAFRSGDDAAAYSHAAPNIKQIFPTVDQFISMVKTGYMPLYNPENFVFGRNAVIGSERNASDGITSSRFVPITATNLPISETRCRRRFSSRCTLSALTCAS